MKYNIKGKIIAITPIVCLITYLLIGFITNIWHPTWAIFFLSAIVPMVLTDRPLYSLYPALCGLAYIIVGFVFNIWHPTWLIFLTIPIYYILFGNTIKHKIRNKIKDKTTVIIDEDIEK